MNTSLTSAAFRFLLDNIKVHVGDPVQKTPMVDGHTILSMDTSVWFPLVQNYGLNASKLSGKNTVTLRVPMTAELKCALSRAFQLFAYQEGSDFSNLVVLQVYRNGKVFAKYATITGSWKIAELSAKDYDYFEEKVVAILRAHTKTVSA